MILKQFMIIDKNFFQVTCATLAGGFWGNHVLHSGVVEFEKATENINSIVKRAQEMTRRYNEVLQKNIEQVNEYFSLKIDL